MEIMLKSVLLAYLLLLGAAHAASPEPTITIIVPYVPGGPGDAQARQLAVRMGSKLGTSVIVNSKPGANGIIGTSTAARAPADSNTILFDATAFSISPALHPSLP